MNLQFVAAGQADIPMIYAQAKSLIDTYEDVGTIDYEKVLNWVKKKITTHIRSYTCVTLEGEKCAYYRLCVDGELDDLYVLPEFQNRGIGTQIMKACICSSEQDLYLYVFSRNIRAIAFYRRFGFDVCKTVGKTRYIMSRKG